MNKPKCARKKNLWGVPLKSLSRLVFLLGQRGLQRACHHNGTNTFRKAIDPVLRPFRRFPLGSRPATMDPAGLRHARSRPFIRSFTRRGERRSGARRVIRSRGARAAAPRPGSPLSKQPLYPDSTAESNRSRRSSAQAKRTGTATGAPPARPPAPGRRTASFSVVARIAPQDTASRARDARSSAP